MLSGKESTWRRPSGVLAQVSTASLASGVIMQTFGVTCRVMSKSARALTWLTFFQVYGWILKEISI